jgi:fumarate reductase subunit D
MTDTNQKPLEHDIFDTEDVSTNKYIATLSYVGIFFLVPLLLKRESAFAQFHAKQGLVLALIFFVGSFFFWIPIIGWGAFLVLMVIHAVAFFKTLAGQAWRIPIVQNLAEKLPL